MLFLFVGYSVGIFYIYEMPELNVIHSLSISDQKISSIALNDTGDWIALGCSGIGQLLVWEWQSKIFQSIFNILVNEAVDLVHISVRV